MNNPTLQKSAVVTSPGHIEIKELPIPRIGDGDMLVKVDLVSICGGDPIEYYGKNVKSRFPLILGHEMVGRIADAGATALKHYGVEIGDRVTVEPYVICGKCHNCLTGYYQLCENPQVYGVTMSSDTPPYLWGAYGEYLYIAPGSKVHKIDNDTPDESAALSSVLGNGVRWVRTIGKLKFGETVVILGAGAQGLVSVIAAKEANAHKIVVIGREKLNLKWELAKEYGADILIDLDQVSNPISELKEILNGDMADLVIECTGASEMMELGLDIIKPLGRYVLVGTRGYEKASLTTDKIVFKELSVLGGLGQSWDTEIAVSIINSRKYALEKMVTDVFPLEEADSAIQFFINNPDKTLRVALRP